MTTHTAADLLGTHGRLVGPDPTVSMSAMRSRPASAVVPAVVSALADGIDGGGLVVVIEPDPDYEPFDSDPGALAAEVAGLRSGLLCTYVVTVAVDTACGHRVCACGPLPPTMLETVSGAVAAAEWSGTYLAGQVTDPYLAACGSDLISASSA